MTPIRFFVISHESNPRVALMALMGDGSARQFLPETGEFHDNPALNDDITHEQYNTYEEVPAEAANALLTSLRPFASPTLDWIVERFSRDGAAERSTPGSLGLEHNGATPSLSYTHSEEEGFRTIHSPIEWLESLGAVDSLTPQVVRSTVATLIQRGFISEPAITRDLDDCRGGAALLGLEHRLKSPASLARKVEMWFLARTPTLNALQPLEVVASIPDIVRYTTVAKQHEELLESAQTMTDLLVDRGHRIVAAEQSYVQGNFYKGFKCVWEAPSGQRWELQLRSTLNIEYKDRAYPHYKASRDLNRSVAERQTSLEETAQIYDQLPTPNRLADNGAVLSSIPISTRLYPVPQAISD